MSACPPARPAPPDASRSGRPVCNEPPRIVALLSSSPKRHIAIVTKRNELLPTCHNVLEAPQPDAVRFDEQEQSALVEQLLRLLFRFGSANLNVHERHGRYPNES
jgi:hypothetical protein